MADANSARIRQTWQRGEQAEFRFSFVNSAGDALVPLDANKYPSYAFIAPSGIQVQTGVAQAYGTPGQYRVLWTIPEDTELSNDEMSWQLQVSFVTARRSQLAHTFDFFVVDKQVTSSGKKEVVGLAIQDSPYRLFWRGDFDPADLTLECYASPYPDHQDMAPIPHANLLTKADMTKVIDGDSIVYYYDVPASAFTLWDALNNHYTAIWSVRETIVSEMQVEYEQFRVIKKNMVQYIQSLRFMVDRFQHRLGTPQHISDGDLCEALTQGLGLFNGWFPESNYNWADFPLQCTTYWVMLSMWWMLGSQHMLMSQLSFSFCVDEDTYVSTNRGLVQAKYLRTGALERDILKLLADIAFNDERKHILDSLVHNSERVVGSKLTAADIIQTVCGSDTVRSQANALSDYGLDQFKSDVRVGASSLIECTEEMIKFIDEVLLANTEYESGLKFNTKFKFHTPYGLDKPQHVWDLGLKPTVSMETEHGYSIKATANHPMLVLTKDLDIVNKELGDIVPGDVVAVSKQHDSEDDNWDVDLSFIVDAVDNYTVKGAMKTCELPRKLTPELARLLGYITSEGYINTAGIISFCNTDPVLLADYVRCFVACFGREPKYTGYQISTAGNKVHYYTESFRRVALFLIGCGEQFKQAPDKEIPWCIMAAPRRLAREFIQSFFEGDGSYTRYNIAQQRNKTFMSFASSSVTMLKQFQSLLLRFGIVTSRHRYTSSQVPQIHLPSSAIDLYAAKIGFWHKGKEHTPPVRYYEQVEAYPKFVGDYIRGLFNGANKGWHTDPETGKKFRVHSGLTLNKTQAIFDSRKPTQANLLMYLEHRSELLAKFRPDALTKLKALAGYDFQWEEVYSVDASEPSNVIDPSFGDVDHPLSHHFYANGFVTHNSGQAVTLDYDQTGAIDSAISRLTEWLNAHMTPAKLMINRQRTGVGSLGIRSQRAFGPQNRVLRYDTVRGLDSNVGFDGILNQSTMYGIFL